MTASEKAEFRNRLGGVLIETSPNADNLAIALCTYFSHHIDRPDNDPETEHGWGEWVEKKTNESLSHIQSLLDEIEGMKVPEEGIEPFVIKHYAGDTRPTIKGNGFDGLEIGEDREEAENFISWINTKILKAARPEVK